MFCALEERDVAQLKRIRPFKGLGEGDLETLTGPARLQSLARGMSVFEAGERVEAIFVILDGWVKLCRTGASGSEAVIGVFSRGDCLAEAEALTGRPHADAATAVSECRLAAIPAAHLRACIRTSPAMALAMLASLGRDLAEMTQEMAELKSCGGPERVARFVLSLCEAERCSTVVLPYEKRLLAARLGLQPETLSRALLRLRDWGVEVDASTVRVADLGALRVRLGLAVW